MFFRHKCSAVCMAALLLTALSGCIIQARPVLDPSVTLAPSPVPSATPKPTPSPTPEPTLAPALTEEPAPKSAQLLFVYDELGAYVTSSEHYKQYLDFMNIQVYEQFGDTFMDAVAVNSYTQPLICGVNIVFSESEAAVAQGRLQTQDGQYVLILQPGENTLYAQINTDISLTLKDFSFVFSEELGVWPK